MINLNNFSIKPTEGPGDPPKYSDPVLDDKGNIRLTTDDFEMTRFGNIDPNRNKKGPAPITYADKWWFTPENTKKYNDYITENNKSWDTLYDSKTKTFNTADNYRLPTENEKLIRMAQLESIPKKDLSLEHIHEYNMLKANNLYVSPALGFQKTMSGSASLFKPVTPTSADASAITSGSVSDPKLTYPKETPLVKGPYGQPMPELNYKGLQTTHQLGQYGSVAANLPEYKNKQAAINQEQEEYKNSFNSLTPEQQVAFTNLNKGKLGYQKTSINDYMKTLTPTQVEPDIIATDYRQGGFMKYAQGGQLPQLTEFNEGGTHEENPLGGIPQGFNNGNLNLVEQGETKLNAANYVFSDTLKVDADTAKLFYLPKSNIGKTFAEVSKKLNRPDSRRENDAIEKNAIEKDLQNLMEAQEKYKQLETQRKLQELESLNPGITQQMMMPSVPQEQQLPQMRMGGNMYDFGGHIKNPELLGKIGNGLSIAAPLLNAIPGVGQIASLAAGVAGGGLKMTSNAGLQYDQNMADQDKIAQANAQANISGMPVQTFRRGGTTNSFVESKDDDDLTAFELGIDSEDKEYPYYPLTKEQAEEIDNQNFNQYYPSPYVGEYALSDFNQAFPSPYIGKEPLSNNNGNEIKQEISVVEKTDPYQSAIQKADETLKDKNLNLEMKQSPAQAIAKGLPAMYNIGMGLFGKPAHLDQNNYITKADIKPYEYNIDPALRQADQTYAQMQSAIKNSGVGAGNYLSNMSQASINRNNTYGQLYGDKYNRDSAAYMQAALANKNIEQGNTQNRMNIEQYNAQAKAAKQAMLAQGLTQLGQIAENSESKNLQTNLLKAIAPDFASTFKYSTYLDQLAEKAKAKKNK